MKLDEKKILDITYSLLGVGFYYLKLIVNSLHLTLPVFNMDFHTSDKSTIQKGIKYKRRITYFDVDLSSSGTTGEPTTVFASPMHWISEQSAQMEYFASNGYRFRDRMIIVRGYAPKEGQSIIKHDKIRNFTWISPFHLTEQNKELILKELQGRYFLRG